MSILHCICSVLEMCSKNSKLILQQLHYWLRVVQTIVIRSLFWFNNGILLQLSQWLHYLQNNIAVLIQELCGFAQEKIQAQNFIGGSFSVWSKVLPQKTQLLSLGASWRGEGEAVRGFKNWFFAVFPVITPFSQKY